MDTQSDFGHWSDIASNKLSKKDQNQCWVFAVYSEYPSKRDDAREYKAFLFRNDKRTIFGLKEFWDWQMVDFRKMTTRVIQDKEFRESFIIDKNMKLNIFSAL